MRYLQLLYLKVFFFNPLYEFGEGLMQASLQSTTLSLSKRNTTSQRLLQMLQPGPIGVKTEGCPRGADNMISVGLC